MQVKRGNNETENDSISQDAQLSQQETLTAGVLAAQKALLSGGPAQEAIPAALGAVGTAAGVDRSYVFAFRTEPDGTVYGSQRYEWVAPGVKPEIDNPDLQNIPMYEAGYGRWVDHFRRYDLIHGPLSEFPESEYETLAAQGIVSLVVIPIYVNAALWGFVGFDDCARPRQWSPQYIDLLLSLSIAIGAALLRELYPEDTHELHPGGLSGIISGYTTIVNSLAEAVEGDNHGDCGLDALTIVRLGLLVRVHDTLQKRFQESEVNLDVCLHELYEHLILALRTHTLSLRLRLDLVPLRVLPELLPPLSMIVTEVLAGVSCGGSADTAAPQRYPAAAVVRLTHTTQIGEIAISIEDKTGTTFELASSLSGARMLLIRRLAADVNAQVLYGDGYVVRVRFPIKQRA